MSTSTRKYRRLSVLSLGTAYVVASMFLMLQQWYFTRADIADDFSSLASIVGTNASAALVFDDEKTGREILSSLAITPDVIEAGLFRNDGTALATFHRAAPDGDHVSMADIRRNATPSFTLREIDIHAPVMMNNDVVGTVVLRVSQRDVYIDTSRFLAGFILISLVALGLGQLVTRGLRRQMIETETAQRESDARLRSVTDHLPVVLFQVTIADDGNPHFSYISESAAPLLGMTPESLLADIRAFTAAVHKDEAAALKSLLAAASAPADAGTALAWTGRFAHRQCGEIWIDIRAGVITTGEGRASISGIIQDVSQIKRYQGEIEQSRLLLQQLASHRENLVDAEHKKIAIEIHDQLGQILTAAMLHLRVLGRTLPATDKNAADLIADIDALLNDAYRSMKDIAASLRPAVLNFGFATAAEWAAERALRNTAIKYHVDVEKSVPELDEREATTFFRIVQEALTNCVRHAGAANVSISLSARGDDLVLVIADDGRGIDEAANPDTSARMGLLGIRERAMALGGKASIASLPGHGVTITVVVPGGASR